MKKKRVSLVLMALFVLSCVMFIQPIAFAGDSTDTKKVVIIRYKLPPDNFNDTVRGLKEEMASKGFTEGKNIQYFDLLTSTGDQASIPEVQAWVEKHKEIADAFVTCGWVGMVTRKMLTGTKIPQICTFVFQPVGENLVGGPLDKPSGSNVTVVYLMYPPEKIISLLKAVKPAATKYGVVWHSKVPADQFYRKWYEELPVDQRRGVQFIYFDLAEGHEKIAADIKSAGLDAFGGGVAIRRPEFASLFSLGIPIIGPKVDFLDVEKIKPTDELLGHYNPYDMCGVQAARILVDVFGGKNISEITPQGVQKQLVFVNLDAAKRLGINIPVALLGGGNLVIK